MPDLEIISVDPNCFYSSNEDDEDVDIEIVHNVTNDTLKPIPSDEFQLQLNESLDIITLNIDDHLLTDSPEDDILFAADTKELQQFDLASYIVGESTSFLLSPPPALLKPKIPVKTSTARQRLISMSDFTNSVTKAMNETDSLKLNTTTVQKTPANNRRKRKNLTREFIYTSSEDDDDNPSDTRSKLDEKSVNNFVNEISSMKKRKDDDPMWNPPNMDTKVKGGKKLLKQSLVTNQKEIKTIEAKKLNKNATPAQGGGGGGGLRNLLKQHLLSNRPIKATKLMKTNSPAVNPDKVKKPSQPPAKWIGVGRGKDISITAKYYNCSESSDNYERDTNHTVRNSIETSSSSSSESDDSDVDMDTLPRTILTKIKVDQSIKPKKDVPIAMDSNSLDSSDFAKALVVNAKPTVVKTKPPTKKVDIEQQKRLIKSTILLQNPAKFKIYSADKTNECQPFRDLKLTNSINTITNVTKATDTQTQEVQTVKEKSEIELKSEPKQIEETNEQMVKDSVDDQKVESNAKRKLNIQEYLKRKNLKKSDANSPNAMQAIKIESISHGPNQNGTKAENESNHNISNGNSMYEEIIIVSMGCNTDISIPEASFIQPSEIKDKDAVKSTALLSKIQTTVEKVNSSAETAIISSCSLISSIQDVILKKTQHNESNENDVKKVKTETDNKGNDDEDPEHGENKVIMHLRKDRIRPTTVTIGIQTEPYFQFPPLKKFSSNQKTAPIGKRFSEPREELQISFNKNKIRNRQKYRGQNNLSESSYYSDEDGHSPCERRSRHSDFYNSNGNDSRRHRHNSHRPSSRYDRFMERNRTISRSLSESSDSSTSSNDSSSTSDSSSESDSSRTSASSRSLNSYGGSSSKSYYGDDNQYYRIRTTSNNSRRNRHQSHRSNSPGLSFVLCFPLPPGF